MSELPDSLRGALEVFVQLPRVLVAADFDGVLAPLVDDPLQARALPGGLEALRAAAAQDGVTAALVSGRDLATLAALTGIGPDDGVALIGSHGAQTSLAPVGSAALLNNAAKARLTALRAELQSIESRYPAVRLEHKPSAVVLHTRGVAPSVAAAATTAAHEVGRRHTGVFVLPGKDVVELTVLEANKGVSLVDLARQTSSEATLYLGDDVTDERAFAALDPGSGDLTVKVGDGETVAGQRVSGPGAVVELLELFVDRRRARG
ncbi:MAG: trehalose-phosphatase [Dermatophilaceae bacterium]